MWVEKLVKVNSITRPGAKLKGVRKIVNHYTANPGASAYNHYLYFNGTAIAQKRYASAHIFVDKTEAYLIIPLNEVAYHANDGTYRGVPELKPNANLYSIGVELCIEKDGSFHPETLRRAAEINAELCKRFKLDPQKDIVRHYDVTRKNCPARWVQQPNEFAEFKKMVGVLMNPKVERYTSNEPILKLGDKGDMVRVIHYFLAVTGHTAWKNRDRDTFTTTTENAVKSFQKEQRIGYSNGIVDYNTWLAFALVMAVYREHWVKSH